MVLCRGIRPASRLIGSLALTDFDRELEASGISRSEFEVLSALARSDHPLRASEVTSITGISGASTTKHTERLAKGLVGGSLGSD